MRSFNDLARLARADPTRDNRSFAAPLYAILGPSESREPPSVSVWQGAIRTLELADDLQEFGRSLYGLSRQFSLSFDHICMVADWLFAWRDNPMFFNVAPPSPRQELERLQHLHEESLNEVNDKKDAVDEADRAVALARNDVRRLARPGLPHSDEYYQAALTLTDAIMTQERRHAELALAQNWSSRVYQEYVQAHVFVHASQ